MKLIIFLLIIFCSSFSFAQPKESIVQAPQSKEILVLNSYHQGFKWTDDITSAIISELNDSSRYRVYVEYMDSKRFQTPEYFNQLNQLYQLKYKGTHLSGIICSDNNALDFIMAYGDSIWGKVPVVFCGLNNPENYINKLDTTRINGIEEKIDIYSTLKVAKQIQPDLEEVIVIGDKTLLFPIFYAQFQEAIGKLQPLKHQVIIAEDIDSLRNTLSKINPEKKAIYLLSLYINKNGIAREMAIEARGILNNFNMHVYSNWDFLMPDLIIGGKLVSGYEQGIAAANLMKHRCSNPNYTPQFTANTPQKFVFDQNQLEKFNIRQSTLPQGSVIAFGKITLWDKYKTEVTIASVVVSILLIIILLLVSTIWQRKRAEYELVESEYRLELAIEGANQGLWDVNLTTRNIFINKQFAILLGYQSPKEMQLNMDNWTKLVYPNDIMQLQEAYFLHQAHKLNSINCEIRMINKNGEFVWMAIHGKISESEGEQPARVTGSILNISNQKEFENQLRKAKDKAEESDRLKSSFLANMSHEIRTPMNTIIGFTDLINADIISEDERKNYLNLIKNSSESLLSLINDIIDISKIESSQMVVIKDTFDLNFLFDNTKDMAESMIIKSKKTIQFLSEKELQTPCFIYSDCHRLEQVLLNLITNAIKFTFSGEIKMGYRFETDKSLVIYLSDTGIGIAEEHMKIIFERFRQCDETQSRRFGGTGLGLAISRSITELLGGQITVNSQLGAGTTFALHFPANTITPPTQ
jgi:PAS domain S-box-containing protein